MPKVIEIYKEVKKIVRIKQFVGAEAELKAAEYLDCSAALIKTAQEHGKRVCGGHYIKKRIIASSNQRKQYDKQLSLRAKALLFRYKPELDVIKGKMLEEYGVDHEVFDSPKQTRVAAVGRQAFCYLAAKRLKPDVGVSLTYAIIAEYLGKHRTTIIHSIDTVMDGLEMPFSDYQWIKKVKL